jgi:3-oxoadipate enol-lactonase
VGSFQQGDKAAAIDGFLTLVVGPAYRAQMDPRVGSDAFELAVQDADTFFTVELPAPPWGFTQEAAARVRQPVLLVLGGESAPIFRDAHAVLRKWMPHSSELVVPGANHALQMTNARAVAEGLAAFHAGRRGGS